MPEKFYHYTGKVARDGICDNHEIWFKLTSESQNDEEDTTYIRKVLQNAIRQSKEDNFFTEKALEVMSSVLNPVPPENERCFIEKNIFMFCVMRERDDEAGKQLCKGTQVYRIELDEKKLVEEFQTMNSSIQHYGEFIFGTVIYDESVQLEQITKVIKKYEQGFLDFHKGKSVDLGIFIPSLSAATPLIDYSGISGYQPALNQSYKWYPKLWEDMTSEEKMFLDKLWVSLANEFYRLSTFIKNPRFITEKEFRIAFCGKLNYKEHKPINTEYCVEFPIDGSIILRDVLL